MEYLIILFIIISFTTQIQIILLIYKYNYIKQIIFLQILNTIIFAYWIYKLIN